jgi:diguanylate cyclase (GGDEF)-like protein/PAS domain S-box-containing protein
MIQHWQSITMAILAVLAIYQSLRAFRVRLESKKREELFQIVTENAADMIALVDVKGNRLYNSPAYKRILGYSAAELGETSGFDQIHPEDRFRVLEAAREARRTGIGKKLEYRIRHKNGSWKVLESIAGTIRDDKGDVVKLVIVNRDVTDRKQAEELAEHNSLHDGLTGLPNRRFFLDRLRNSFERSRRNPDQQHTVLFVDLDGFKGLNETAGSAVADRVIIEMGTRIGSCLRDEDTFSRAPHDLSAGNAVLSRMGGDEFTILLEGIADPSDAMRVAKRILAAVAKPFDVEAREVRISASIGIALSTTSQAHADTLLQEAEVAMRRAKALGGSRCELFDEALHKLAVNRLKLESELRQAVEQNEFRVYYQPIVELASCKILGFEALLRWQHPEQGLISPNRFLAAAEDTGLLVSTGQWLILQACKQLCAWADANYSFPTVMSFNLSAKQLSDPGLVGDLEAIVRDTRIDASCLRLEITERVGAADPKLSYSVLSQLKHLGIGVILDDFGAGNSSLSTLRQLPLQGLKIDRDLVGGMLSDRDTYETIDLIVVLAHKLNLEVTAEGIETPKHLEALRELGCEMGQGYFFSPPVSEEAAGKLLREGSLEHWKKTAAAR